MTPRSYFKPLLYYVGVPLLAFLVIFIFVNNFVMPIITKHGEEFVLPSLVGKTEFEADEIAQKSELTLEVAGREYSIEKPQGQILTQVPEAGTMVKKGRNVKIVVSAGTRMSEVPDVYGLPLAQATITLQKAGFQAGDIVWMKVDSLPKNTAIETIPSHGATLPAGAKVSIAVNQGEEQNILIMPSLVGLPLDRARERLESLGLVLDDIKRVKEERYLPNTVLDQKPAQGTQVLRGERIKLSVSKTD